MMERIREFIGKEYANTLGVIAYKNGEKVIEEYFKGAHENESVHTYQRRLGKKGFRTGWWKGTDWRKLPLLNAWKCKSKICAKGVFRVTVQR